MGARDGVIAAMRCPASVALLPDPVLRGRANRAHPFCRSRTGAG
ncbi:hypothetical protein AB0L88_10995 [Saccharopolyspora shandongensis]